MQLFRLIHISNKDWVFWRHTNATSNAFQLHFVTISLSKRYQIGCGSRWLLQIPRHLLFIHRFLFPSICGVQKGRVRTTFNWSRLFGDLRIGRNKTGQENIGLLAWRLEILFISISWACLSNVISERSIAHWPTIFFRLFVRWSWHQSFFWIINHALFCTL